MHYSQKIVTKLPLVELWTDTYLLDAKRREFLGRTEIKSALKSAPVQFVVANPGDKLIWVSIENCYQIGTAT